MTFIEPDITDFLLCKLDDNKYEAHEGTIWRLNADTFMDLKSLQGGVFSRSNIEGARQTIMGLDYKIDHSMKDGEIKLDNSPDVPQKGGE